MIKIRFGKPLMEVMCSTVYDSTIGYPFGNSFVQHLLLCNMVANQFTEHLNSRASSISRLYSNSLAGSPSSKFEKVQVVIVAMVCWYLTSVFTAGYVLRMKLSDQKVP